MKMIQWTQCDSIQRARYLERPALKIADISVTVKNIIATVKKRGDEALMDYTQQFDGVNLDDLVVSPELIEGAEIKVDAEKRQCLQETVKRIENYQKACLPTEITVDTGDGIVCRRRPVAIESVGLYVPGGRAPLVSTLLMLGVPAKMAGCKTKVLCTPPNKMGEIDPLLLLAAKYCGIDRVIKVGGAQAVAAMAYGTQSVPKVNKIFGPGNAWVTCAKTRVANDPKAASIDMPAGPSEIMVIADASANADFIAADLLSQAEHGPDSQVILLTDSKNLASAVLDSIDKQQACLSRQEVIQQCLINSVAIVVENIREAIEISNAYAPEHLSLQLVDPDKYLNDIRHAGAVFVGAWTPETMGDYITGSNHVLPTYAYANRISGLSVADFMKTISIQQVSRRGLKQWGPTAMSLAAMEGLTAHKNAVDIRLTYLGDE